MILRKTYYVLKIKFACVHSVKIIKIFNEQNKIFVKKSGAFLRRKAILYYQSFISICIMGSLTSAPAGTIGNTL